VNEKQVGTCSEGVYSSVTCTGDSECLTSGENASCVLPELEDTGDTEPPIDDTDEPEPSEEEPNEEEPNEEETEETVRPGAPTTPGFGCQVSPAAVAPWWMTLFGGLTLWWRRRSA